MSRLSHVPLGLSKERIPVLDGLRFIAAFSVMLAHYAHWILCDQGLNNYGTNLLASLSVLGMPLFFALSGFVIHYNYHHVRTHQGAVKAFLIARFTRLYPLYIILFVIEFVIAFHLRRGSCGHAGERWGFLLALPYYLTLTQDWVYAVIAKNNLIYQYHMVSAVTWSISLEVFFYIIYLFFSKWLKKQKYVVRQIIFIVIAQTLVVLYLFYCNRFESVIDHVALVGFGPYATTQHSYQDSLLRWLYSFNPLVNLPAFFIGAVFANIYMNIKDRPMYKTEQQLGIYLTCLSITMVLAIHYWLYMHIAQTNKLIARTASALDAPLIAIMIFFLVRYSSTIINKIISSPLLTKLGEASYSIYLLHAFFGWYPRDFYFLKLNPWLLYFLALMCILVMSRCSYVIFERPIQHWLRKQMMKEKKYSQSINIFPSNS